jgi:hypothetical protein
MNPGLGEAGPGFKEFPKVQNPPVPWGEPTPVT